MRKHHTKTKGDLGVLKAQCALAEQEFTVLVPLTEHSEFDVVGYKNGKFIRLQVKYRSMDKHGTIQVHFRSTWSDVNGLHVSQVNKEEIDIYCIYCPDTDKCYFLNPDQFGHSVALRVNAPRNNQQQGVHFAEDYLRVP
jgi:hypothetical protein